MPDHGGAEAPPSFRFLYRQEAGALAPALAQECYSLGLVGERSILSDEPLEDLAASVADGDEVDWEGAEAGAESERNRRVIKDLRLIANIAAFCRTNAGEEPAALPEPPSVERPVGRWGAFELIQRIGEGAFGDVYRARDALHRDVALKLLRASQGTSTSQLSARILHEGRVLARVRHTSVVTVYGAEEHDGRVGLWMEFIEGRTLEAILQAQGPFGAREAALIGRELCRAVAAVHGAGLVHRDIKAQNVMREAGGRLVLMDFGAGQPIQGDVRRGGKVTGTPLYLAPELLHSAPATVQSDIYSLGVLLYHLVTNTYPVRASSLEELKAAHAAGTRQRLTDVRPDLPEDFVRIVERAVDADPARRFASAGAMADALSHTLAFDTWMADTTAFAGSADAPATSSRLSQSGSADVKPTPWLRRRGLWVAGAVLLVLGMAAAFAIPAWRRAARPNGGSLAPSTLRLVVRPDSVGEPTVTSLLTDQLTQDLGASPHLRLIAPAAVDALRDRPVSALMQSLEADALIEVAGNTDDGGAVGTVKVSRAGREGVLLTSRTPQASRLRELARDLAERVVGALQVKDQTWRPSLRTELPLDNPEALRAFRQGQALLDHGGREDVGQAAERFREATQLAPDFVLAYAKWAEALLSLYRHNALSAGEAFPVAQDAIAQALRRDEASGEAHAALADLYVEKDRDWSRAETTFRRALTLSPSSEYARIRFAMMLSGRGRTGEAVSQSLEAQSLNPRSSLLRGYAGASLHYAGRYVEAAKMYEGTLQLDSQYNAAWIGLCKAYAGLGRFEQARDACEQVERTGAAEPPFVESQLVQIFADAGRTREARQHLGRLLGLYKAQPNADTAFWIALAHASLHDRDQAFRWLDEAIAGRSSRLLYARVDARLDPLRSDPRYAERETRIDAAGGAR
jgi:serine/threonine protein kinase/tetratricopeptide (TPR) repeat protein